MNQFHEPDDAAFIAQLQRAADWLAERKIVPRELVMLHVLNFRVVFRAILDTDGEADQFVAQFG